MTFTQTPEAKKALLAEMQEHVEHICCVIGADRETGQLSALTEFLADMVLTKEREQRAACAEIARDHALIWPESIFTPEGTTMDADSARFARSICEDIAAEIERGETGEAA